MLGRRTITMLLFVLMAGCGAGPLPASDTGVVVNNLPGRTSHTWFPVTSASPHGTVACDQCHSSTTFQEIACTSCHTHAENTMANVHAGMLQYQYNAKACYACHPHPQHGAP